MVSPSQQRSAAVSRAHSSQSPGTPGHSKSATQNHHRSIRRASEAEPPLVPSSKLSVGSPPTAGAAPKRRFPGLQHAASSGFTSGSAELREPARFQWGGAAGAAHPSGDRLSNEKSFRGSPPRGVGRRAKPV